MFHTNTSTLQCISSPFPISMINLRFLSSFCSPLKALICVNDILHNISIIMLFSYWLYLKKKSKKVCLKGMNCFISDFTMLSETVSYGKESAGAEV